MNVILISGLGTGLAPKGAKPLPEPMMTRQPQPKKCQCNTMVCSLDTEVTLNDMGKHIT